jgi:hypothetical protein
MLLIDHPDGRFVFAESGVDATERRRTLEDFAAKDGVAAMAAPVAAVQTVVCPPHSRPDHGEERPIRWRRDIRCCMAHTPSKKIRETNRSKDLRLSARGILR